MENDLGSTATDAATGGASGSGSTGGSESLSQTSSPSSTTADPSSGETASEESGSESGGPVSCDGLGSVVQWTGGGDPLPGIDAEFRAAAVGNCTVTDLVVQDSEPQIVTITFDCQLDAIVDGVHLEALGAQPTFELVSAAGPPAGLAVDDEVFLRFAADEWGDGWNRWMILTTAGASPSFLLEMMTAERLHPQAGDTSPLIDEIGTLLGDDGWSSGLDYTSVSGICELINMCGSQPRAVEVETTTSVQTVEPGESTVLGLEGGPQVNVSVTTAHEYPMKSCTDTPNAMYEVGAIAVES